MPIAIRGIKSGTRHPIPIVAVAPVLSMQVASASTLLTDNFTSHTPDGSWLSGGNPESACLTTSTSTTDTIPGCDSETALDIDGSGALRLTSNANTQAGFVIDQTSISTAQGPQVFPVP